MADGIIQCDTQVEPTQAQSLAAMHGWDAETAEAYADERDAYFAFVEQEIAEMAAADAARDAAAPIAA